jgi:hypothetical protein
MTIVVVMMACIFATTRRLASRFLRVGSITARSISCHVRARREHSLGARAVRHGLRSAYVRGVHGEDAMTRVLIAIVAVCVVSASARAEEDDEEPPLKAGKTVKKKKKKPRPVEVEEADDEPPPKSGKATPDADAPAELVEVGSPKGRMTLPGGKFMFNVIGEANMAKGATGKPLSIAPDLWIGVADRLTFGIVHSGRGATGFLTGFGTGLCFRGGENGACSLGLGDVYTFAAAEARIGISQGGFALALVLGAQARAFEPKLVLSGKAGFLVRLHGKRLALELGPMAYIGITQRKVAGMELNRDEVGVPATIFLRLAPSFSLVLQSGVTFLLKKPGETYRIPAAAGLAWWVSSHFSLDVTFGLAAVADRDPATKPFDARSASVGVGLAL